MNLLRRARPLPAGVRPHRRPDAARPLPRVHRGRAHPDGDPQPAPLHRGAARARVSAVLAAHRRLRATRGALRRGPVPRHRQGTRRRPLDARRARRAPLLPRARPVGRGRASSSRGSSSSTSSMSSTAQKQDLSDPEVIAAFARKVGSERRLTALYLLTVADIRGTSPKVWNAGRASCSRTCSTRRARVLGGDGARRARVHGQHRRAAGGGAAPAAPVRRAGRRRARAVEASRHAVLPAPQAEEIAWHARHLYWRVDTAPAGRQGAAVARRRRHAGAGLRCPTRRSCSRASAASSARAACRSSRRRSTRRAHGFALDTFALNDPAQRGGVATARRCRWSSTSSRACSPSSAPLEPPPKGRISRRVKHFPLTPEVQIFPDDKGTHYILEVVAGDRPGLLARIAYTLAQGERQRREREDQHAGRPRGGRVPDRRRAAARRAGAAAAGDGAVRGAAYVRRAGTGRARFSLLRRVAEFRETARR